MKVDDITLLITRPSDLAAPLTGHLAKQGFQVLQEPLLQTLPLADSSSFIEAAQQIQKAAWAVFVSPMAVHFACALWQQFFGAWPDTLKIAAVGQSTAMVLHEKGIHDVLHPKRGSGAKALFELLKSEDLHGKVIAIFRAMAGKPLLFQLLQSKGAIPIAVPCYERRLGNIAKALANLCQYHGRKVIICTSSELARAMLPYRGLLVENEVLVLANHPQIVAVLSAVDITTELLDSMNPETILDKLKENP